MAAEFDIREINDAEALEPLRADWTRLLAETPGAGFFQSLDWLAVYWRHHGAGQKLRVLVASRGGQTAGIVPLEVRTEATRAGAVRVLTYPLHDWGSFYGPIGPDQQPVLAAALGHVRRTRRDWDMIELRWIDPDDAEHGRTAGAFRAAGWHAERSLWNETAVVDMSVTWDEYLASRGGRGRQNFRRLERRLADEGRLTYVRHRPRGEAHGDADPRWDLYDACEDVARRSWQGSSTTGTTLTHEPVRPFLHEAHAAAARAGGVDLNLLLLDGRPLAFAYNYVYRGSVYGLRVGYDAAMSKTGAGNVLYYWIVRDGFFRGDRLYDLGVGSLDVKRPLLTHVRPIYRYSHYAWTAPRAQLVRLKRWLSGRFDRPAAVPVEKQPSGQ